MKKLLMLVLALGGLLAVTAQAQAWGGGCGSCASYCTTYVDQVVTCYRPVMMTKDVPVTVYEMVPREIKQQVKYYECVAVPGKVKATQYYQETIARQVPVTYYEPVQVVTPTTYHGTHYKMVPKQVPVTYYECVAVPGKQVVRQVSYTTVPRPVTYQVPVCTMSYCSVCDPCSGCCYTVCHPVTTWKTVHSTVYECVPAYKDVTIDVVTYKQVPRPGVQTVYECVPVPYDYVVNVVSCKLVPKPGMRTVYECVPRSRDVLVDVVNYQKVEKTAWVSYYVCEYVPKPTVVRQAYCVMQPYQYTVKVPVCVPVGCGSTCGYYGH